MALPAIGDGEQVGDGNTGETLLVGRTGQPLQIGGSAATLVGFHGASPVDQAAVVASVTLPGWSAGGFGAKNTAAMTALFAAVNAITACLREKGLMASS